MKDRAIPRRVNFGYAEDDLAAKMARYGKSVALISRVTGLTKCQVQRRYKMGRASPMAWRNGLGQTKAEALAEIEALEKDLQLHAKAMEKLPIELRQLTNRPPHKKR